MLGSAVAVILGFGAIGPNLIITSLVCYEMVATLDEFKAGLRDQQVVIRSIKEVLRDSIRDKNMMLIEGNRNATSSLQIRKRRILERLTTKPYMEVSTQISKTICKCSRRKICPLGVQKKRRNDGQVRKHSGKANLPGFEVHRVVFASGKKYEICQPEPKGGIGLPGPDWTSSFRKEPELTENCECDKTEDIIVPTVGNPTGAVRRFPMKKISIPLRDSSAETNAPTPSQIALQSNERVVKIAPRRILYFFNQNGRVNITHIRGFEKYSSIMEPSVNESPLTRFNTASPPPYRYQYIGRAERSKPRFFPSRLSTLFVKRLKKMLGGKSHVPDKTYAIEKGTFHPSREMVLIDRMAKATRGRNTKGKKYRPLDRL